MNRTEIQTAEQRPAIAVVDGRAVPDWEMPAGAALAEQGVTVDQVTALLRAAADYQRAARPIVLHTVAEPVPAAQTAPAHPGVTVTYPAPALDLTPPAAARRLFTRAELVFACGVTSACSALVAGIAAAVTASPMPLAAAAVVGIGTSVGAAVTMTGDDDRAQLKAWRDYRRGGAGR